LIQRIWIVLSSSCVVIAALEFSLTMILYFTSDLRPPSSGDPPSVGPPPPASPAE
jgi:hypothetical protein